jgi:hypothetical protein
MRQVWASNLLAVNRTSSRSHKMEEVASRCLGLEDLAATYPSLSRLLRTRSHTKTDHPHLHVETMHTPAIPTVGSQTRMSLGVHSNVGSQNCIAPQLPLRMAVLAHLRFFAGCGVCTTQKQQRVWICCLSSIGR